MSSGRVISWDKQSRDPPAIIVLAYPSGSMYPSEILPLDTHVNNVYSWKNIALN